MDQGPRRRLCQRIQWRDRQFAERSGISKLSNRNTRISRLFYWRFTRNIVPNHGVNHVHCRLTGNALRMTAEARGAFRRMTTVPTELLRTLVAGVELRSF